MKKVAFLSTGCQVGLSRPREIIATNPELTETPADEADFLMINICAMCTENINRFSQLKSKLAELKKTNPKLQVLAGGCATGLPQSPQGHNPAPTRPDLSFADAVFDHQGETQAFLQFLSTKAPEITIDPACIEPCSVYGVVSINIAQGCKRRCTFCKTHFLGNMQLTSRPTAEIISLAEKAAKQGNQIITLTAENSTEYGADIGTNLESLLAELYQINGIRYVDVYGLCLDEIRPSLLQKLQHEKIRYLQLEIQSLNNQIRRNMHLAKDKDEALAILDALKDKAIISNLIAGFPGHSIREFNKELQLARAHHFYFLSFDPYDDTSGTPSHLLYKKPSTTEERYYYSKFLEEIGKERQLLLDQLLKQPFIEAAVSNADGRELTLQATRYSARIYARDRDRRFRAGDLIKVKITRLHEYIPENIQQNLINSAPAAQRSEQTQLIHYLRYFDSLGHNQFLPLDGQILS